MQSETINRQKARYLSSVTGLYLVALLLLWFVINPGSTRSGLVQALSSQPIPSTPYKKIMAGRPIRVVLPDQAIDLTVDPGYFDASNNSWTLSGYNAQYAMVTKLANNHDGNTFIYGHNNKYVLGHIKTIKPGQKAILYTDNNQVFTYTFVSTVGVGPDDTRVFDYSGPPILTIQTCSGNWNEIRQMYTFKFQNFTKQS